ncbi:hypothetical protein GWI33_021270 [Rhynchophorus ferrugineus]|uniref:Mos1 transposase HTH domain-containing protein n=1 Tax=Rhynchophorus ferrugineus TaxID=354439 RepID=A0A834HN22_RHYFE|nr:hypothetical protein GWI33_021270 [Rhynchophorus ferrugineus]
MDEKKFRVLIKYCFLKGKNTIEARTWLDAEFPDSGPGKSTIKDCYCSALVQCNVYCSGIEGIARQDTTSTVKDRYGVDM